MRRSLHHLSACAVEVVLLIRNNIDKEMIDDLKAHADRVPTEVLKHDKTIKQDALQDEKSIKQDDPHNTSVTNEPASSLHARVRQQSRGNLRGAKGEFHLTIYSLHPLRLLGEYNSAYKFTQEWFTQETTRALGSLEVVKTSLCNSPFRHINHIHS